MKLLLIRKLNLRNFLYLTTFFFIMTDRILTPDSVIQTATTFLYEGQNGIKAEEVLARHGFVQEEPSRDYQKVPVTAMRPKSPSVKMTSGHPNFLDKYPVYISDFTDDRGQNAEQRLAALGLEPPSKELFIDLFLRKPIGDALELSDWMAGAGFDVFTIGHFNMEEERLYATPNLYEQMQAQGVEPVLHLAPVTH